MKSAQSKTGEAGAKATGKSHDADVALGEGLAQGSVHSAHKKMSVKDAKHVKGLQMAAQAANERRENGKANSAGE